MAKINYPNKVIGSKFKADEANEIKTSVNALYDDLDAGTSVIKNQSDEVQDASFRIAGSANIGEFGITESFISPQITGHQGYTTDGTFHYITDTSRIDKRNNDGTWSIVLSNASPFTGISGVNHLGDVEYFNGKLYVPVETYGGCGDVSGQKIVLYNSTTLALDSQFDISSQGHEASSVGIDGINNIAYVSSYCDGSKLWKYNATTFAFLGTLSLSVTIDRIQGCSYHNGFIYIGSESSGLLKVNETTGDVTFLAPRNKNFLIQEGIHVTGTGQIRLLVDNTGDSLNSNVYFFDESTQSANFHTDKTSESYFGNDVFIGNTLNISSISQTGVINAATTSNSTSALYLEYLPQTQSFAALTHDLNNTALIKNGHFFEGAWIRPVVTKNSFGLFLNDSASRIEMRSSPAAASLNWDTRWWINLAGDANISSSSNVLNGTGSHAAEQTVLLRNTDATGASGMAFRDDVGNKFFSIGVKNSASTLDAGYGVIGEAFMRSSSSATGFSVNCVNGPLRFSWNSVEAFRIAATTRNIVIGSTSDNGYKVDIVGATLSRIIGTSAAPSTSGSALNGSLRLSATGVTATVLDVGVNGGNSTSWIQARSSADYTINRTLQINPNGGGVLTGNKSGAADPTTADIPAGMNTVWKNTTSGVTRLWTNDGGTMKSVTLA